MLTHDAEAQSKQTNSLSPVSAIDLRRHFLTGGPSLSRYFRIKRTTTTGVTTGGSGGISSPLFENMGLVIRPTMHRNSEGGGGTV